jgi:hypothetical protein
MRRPDEGHGRCTSGPGELVERDRADVIVTTDLGPLIVTAVPGEDQEALARRRYLLADVHRDPGARVPRDSNPHVSEGGT